MIGNNARIPDKEKVLLERIKKNTKGQFYLPDSSNMHLKTLQTWLLKGLNDEELLKKISTLKPEDLAAARLFIKNLNKEETIENPPVKTTKIIALPLANTIPPVPVITSTAKPATVEPKPVITGNSVQPEEFYYNDKLGLKDRVTLFGKQILWLYQDLPQTPMFHHIGDQMLRSATSVGAHYREAIFTRTPSEFISKISVGLQELEETKHWMDLLADSGFSKKDILAVLRQEAEQVTDIFISAIKLAKVRLGGK
jgi:four helix bundle protein